MCSHDDGASQCRMQTPEPIPVGKQRANARACFCHTRGQAYESFPVRGTSYIGPLILRHSTRRASAPPCRPPGNGDALDASSSGVNPSDRPVEKNRNNRECRAAAGRCSRGEIRVGSRWRLETAYLHTADLLLLCIHLGRGSCIVDPHDRH